MNAGKPLKPGKAVKYIIWLILGIGICLCVMYGRGLSGTMAASDLVLAICDGCTVTALCFLSMGVLVWVATTGFFDIFSYAVRKGAHMLVPSLVRDLTGDYYSYKMDRQESREGKGQKGEKSLFLAGVGFLLASLVLTVVWYQL